MDKQVDILGCRFHRLGREELLNQIQEQISQGGRGYLSTVNVSILMQMRNDKRLNEIIHGSRYIVPDGQPVVWTSRLLRSALPERITGVDMVTWLAQLAVENDWGVFLLGATQEVLEEAGNALTRQVPGLDIVGSHHGYFDADAESDIVRRINESGARILITGMGVPRQEYFIGDRWNELNVALAIGVGGSFDVISGLRKRAPRWIQRSGMEWFYRAVQEPQRLFPRYIKTNSQFLGLVVTRLIFKFD